LSRGLGEANQRNGLGLTLSGLTAEIETMHSSLAIANEFLKRARDEQRALTQMHLQKLVYLAHGWNLAVNGRELIEDEFEAWEFGPVVRKLYNALSKYGKSTVTRLICWGDDTPFPSDDDGPAIASLDEKELAVIDKVWEQYRGFEAFQLSALTHAPQSPWSNTYERGKNKVINNNFIWDYFADLASA
jgi:uncharacterized phage-associated protein